MKKDLTIDCDTNVNSTKLSKMSLVDRRGSTMSKPSESLEG